MSDFMLKYQQALDQHFDDLFDNTTRKVPKVSDTYDTYMCMLMVTLDILDAEAGCIAFLDDGLKDFESIIAYGYGEDFIWWDKVKYGEGIVSQVAESGSPKFIQDVKNEKSYKSLCAGTNSQITIPLNDKNRFDGNVFAVISIESSGNLYDKTEIAYEVIALVLSGTLLKVRDKLLSMRMRELYSLINRLSEEDDYKKLIGEILRHSKSFVDSSEVALLIRNGAHLKVEQRQDFDEETPENLFIGINAGKGYTCFVAQTRKSFYCANVNNAIKYPYYLEVVPKTKSQYTVPLIYRNDLVGVLNIGSAIEYGFTKHDRELIDIFAGLVANAVYNSKLMYDLRLISYNISMRLQNVNFLSNSVLSALRDENVKSNFKLLKQSANQARQLILQSIYPMKEGLGKEESISDVLKLLADQFEQISKSKGIDFEFIRCAKKCDWILVSRQHSWNVICNVIWHSIDMLNGQDKKVLLVEERIDKHDINNGTEIITYYVIEVRYNSDDSFDYSSDEYLERYAYYTQNNDEERSCEGLGLWVCDQVLSSYGGYLEIKSLDRNKFRSLLVHLPISTK